MIILILSLLIGQANAGDDWLCKEEASIKRGNSIYACGVAKAHLEQEAKDSAFVAAQNEFKNICNASESCKDKKIDVEAKRTECEAIPKIEGAFMPGQNYYQFKCYRLVVFTMQNEEE